jgi:hypothetical protein
MGLADVAEVSSVRWPQPQQLRPLRSHDLSQTRLPPLEDVMMSTIRSLSFLLAAITILAASLSCSGRGPNGAVVAPKPIGAISPAPIKTPYFGIVRMWKGNVQSIHRYVLIVWAIPDPGANWIVTSNKVFGRIKGDVDRTNLQVVIIKVVRSSGSLTETDSNILVKNQRGIWERTQDVNLVDKIIQAGLGP